jgi:hypothetical protein
MTILDTETGQQIAHIISRIDAANIMYRHTDGNHSVQCYWMLQEFTAIITLKEKYGIPHVCYKAAKEGMEREHIANALL